MACLLFLTKFQLRYIHTSPFFLCLPPRALANKRNPI